MPYVSDTEWQVVKRKIDELDREVEKLKYVKGQPIVQGYAGKKLDLNENLNVVNLLSRLTTDETTIATKQATITDTITFTVGGSSVFRLRAEAARLYIEITTDGGLTWSECTSWPV